MRIPSVNFARWVLTPGGDLYNAPFAGSVGIGVTDPVERLDIDGALHLGAAVNSNPGTLEWNGVNFRAHNGIEWLLLDAQGGGSGWIRITDIVGTGGESVSEKVYQDADETILQSCTASGNTLNVTVKSSYPRVELFGTGVVELSENGGGGYYEGSFDVTIAGTEDYVVTAQTPDDEEGATDTVAISIFIGAAVQTAVFDGVYPTGPGGLQTEVKEDDTFDIDITADKLFDMVRVVAAGACKFQEYVVSPAATAETVTAIIEDNGNVSVARAATVQVRDNVTKAWSTEFVTTSAGSDDGVHTVLCNNLRPSGSHGTIVYSSGFSALKDSETATVVNTAANYDTIAYTSPTGELIVTSPGTFQSPKTVQRNSGTYNVSTINLRSLLTRNANGSQTTIESVVAIAHVAAQLTVTYPGARIRSGDGAGNDTVITITSNQLLPSAPSMAPAASRGTFQGGAFTGGPTVWTRTLRVTDAENPTDNSSNAWVTPSATNLAGIVTNTITTNPTYVVGGFTARTHTYDPFLADSNETVPLTDESKLSVGVFSNGNPGVVQPFGTPDTTDDGKEGWVAPDAASGTAVGTHMLHSPTAAAHTGTLTLTLVEETV